MSRLRNLFPIGANQRSRKALGNSVDGTDLQIGIPRDSAVRVSQCPRTVANEDRPKPDTPGRPNIVFGMIAHIADLARYERFQLVLTIILPSCSPDASALRSANLI